MIADRIAARPGGAPATFRFGTHRRRSPAATLAAIRSIAESCGVTRLADVTGLDIIGIPVFQAIRPLARSLSVSQGKGVTRVAARVSALMESIELDHAESVAPSQHGPARPGDCAAPGKGGAIDWCEGTNLLSGAATRVPHALVSMDYARPGPHPVATSNGLASGNDLTEAIVSGLCEAIERDALSRWSARPAHERHRAAIDPDTVTAPLGRRLLRAIRSAGLGIRLWSVGDDHGATVIACVLYELSPGPILGPLMGAGAHLDPVVALARAVTEAAQARVTLIAGARDDLTDADYATPGARRLHFLLEYAALGPAPRDWSSLEAQASGCQARDTDTLLAGMERAGAGEVACVRLSDPALPIAVVKILVPGFLGHAGRGQTMS
jgi:ribosomal protein S12 methylthiotransferase accessory factor